MIKDVWVWSLSFVVVLAIWFGCEPVAPTWDAVKAHCPAESPAREVCAFSVNYASQACVDGYPQQSVWDYLEHRCGGYDAGVRDACLIGVSLAQEHCSLMHRE